MSNPFDDEGGMFLALKNAEGQHSLWPQQFEVPEGWSVVSGPAARADCIEYIERNWTDLRPERLIHWMEQTSRAEKRPESSSPDASRPV
jgi:uncharacterized protein YbdZ (MbtH family)